MSWKISKGVCDRVVMLSGGKVVVEGRIDELARQITREIEYICVGWGHKLEQWLLQHGHKVRRMGRICGSNTRAIKRLNHTGRSI